MAYLGSLQVVGLPNLSDLDMDLSKSLRQNVIIHFTLQCTVFPIYSFPLRFTSKIWLILAHLRQNLLSLQNLSDLDFDLSMSLKVKSDGAVGLTPHMPFPMVFNSNTWPNSAPLRDLKLRYLSDLDIDLSRSL